MALTVEELQIVLKCDATTAQEVLKQMDATVKAYTEKFQKYFQTRTGKVQPLDNVAKQVDSAVRKVESQTKRLKKAAADWKEQYKKTWGEDFDSSMMKAKIRSSVDRMGKEYKPSGQKYVGSGGGMGDPNYFRNSEAYNMTYGNRTPNNELVDFGAKIRATLEDSLGSVNTISGAMKMKIGDALVKLRDLANEYRKAVTEHGSDSPQATAAEQKFKKAIYAADGYIQKLDKVAAKEKQAEAAADPTKIQAFMESAEQKIDSVKNSISSARKRLSKFGAALKKAFNQTLLGKFIKRLGTVALRMAAMKVIRGTIQGISQGLEELAKKSKSSAKAMNTVKGAGNSIKMSLGMAVMPIVKALAPIFVQLAGVVNAACNALARFFAVVTGQSTYTAVGFSDALDGVSDSADGAGKSAKRAVAAFDELNIIGQQGGGGGGGTDLTNPFSQVTGDLPAFSELGTKIREAIENGDWRGVGSAIAGKLNEAINSWQPEETAHKISNVINSALEIAIGLLEDVNGFDLGKKIGDFIANVDWAGIIDRLVEGAGAAAVTLQQSIWGIIWGAIEPTFQDLYDKCFEEGKFSFNGMLDGISDLFLKTNLAIWAYDHIITPLFNGVARSLLNDSTEENPGKALGEKILDGIAAVFSNIGEWVKTHIVKPIKDWFSGNAIGIDFDLQLPDLKSFKDVWDKLKGGTKTFTAKLTGVKDSVIEKVQKNWNLINDKTANLEANIQEGIEDRVASIKTAWNDLKAGTKKMTANLSGAGVTAFEKLKTAWSGISTKTSTMTASLSQNFTQTQLDNLKNAWNGIKESVTSKFTASLNVGATVQNFIDKWNALKDKKVTIQAVSDKFKETWNSIAAKWNASSFLRGIFTMPTLASGGVTYGPTMAMIGEYAGAKSNPEVIAPLSTLVGLLQRANATGTNKDAMTKEQADVMIRLLQRIEQKSNVITPSVALGQVMSRSANLYART